MLPGDNVVLIVVFRHGAFIPIGTSAKEASAVINCWWTIKDNIRRGTDFVSLGHTMTVEDCRKWIAEAVYAANFEYSNGAGDYIGAAWAWSDVIAMYVRPAAPPEGEEWKYGDK
jgi:hypothetical protein